MSETNYVAYEVVPYNPNGERYRTTDIALEAACLRGDVKSIRGNPVGIKALKNAFS
jgi:hypothetical protein